MGHRAVPDCADTDMGEVFPDFKPYLTVAAQGHDRGEDLLMGCPKPFVP
jgi:hypothetical protein